MMKQDTLTGWPLIGLTTALIGSILAAAAGYAYRNPGRPAVASVSYEAERLRSLEVEVAELRRDQSELNPSRFNEVRQDGHFIRFREREPGSMVIGVTGAGYSDTPISSHHNAFERRVLSGAGLH
jgi:hypothetical protein